MEENRNDIEILKAMIKENFEEQRKLIAKLETALEAVTSFNGKQMLAGYQRYPDRQPEYDSGRCDPCLLSGAFNGFFDEQGRNCGHTCFTAPGFKKNVQGKPGTYQAAS